MFRPAKWFDWLLLFWLACASTPAWAPPARVPARRPPGIEIHPVFTPDPGLPTSHPEPPPGAQPTDTPAQRVEAARTARDFLARPPFGALEPRDFVDYHADLALALYDAAILGSNDAFRLAQGGHLYGDWKNFIAHERRSPGREEWLALVAREEQRLQTEAKRKAAEKRHAANMEKKRLQAQQQRESEQRDAEIKERAKAYEAQGQALPDEVVHALQAARLGRLSLLDPRLPNVQVRLSDNPQHDRAIVTHVRLTQAVLLSQPLEREKLSLINLFSDPAGDHLTDEINHLLNLDDSNHKASALAQVTQVLKGERVFDQATLTAALAPLSGQAVYIVSHIPEAAPKKGVLEYSDGNNVTATPISALEQAFRAANVNLLIVGCSSALHAPVGVDRPLNNVEALESFHAGLISDVKNPVPRPALDWHALFLPAGTMLIIDALPTKLPDSQVDSSMLRMEARRGQRRLSEGYGGGFARPPLPAYTSLPATVPVSIASGLLPAPDAGVSCTDINTPAVSAAQRLVPIATTFLVFLYLLGVIATARSLYKEGEALWVSVFPPLLAGAPLVISRYAWGACWSGCRLVPGPWLPFWGLIYSLAFLALVIGLSKADRALMRRWPSLVLERGAMPYFLLCFTATALFAASYFGVGADRALVNYCEAFLHFT